MIVAGGRSLGKKRTRHPQPAGHIAGQLLGLGAREASWEQRLQLRVAVARLDSCGRRATTSVISGGFRGLKWRQEYRPFGCRLASIPGTCGGVGGRHCPGRWEKKAWRGRRWLSFGSPVLGLNFSYLAAHPWARKLPLIITSKPLLRLSCPMPGLGAGGILQTVPGSSQGLFSGV